VIPTRLKLALDRYGSDLTRWPPDLATQARAELARSETFRAALAKESAFDAMLREADPARRIDPAVLARVEAMVMASLPAMRRNRASGLLGSVVEALSPGWGWGWDWQRSLAAMLVLAAMLGMAAGSALPVPDWTAPSAGEALASKSFYRVDLQ